MIEAVTGVLEKFPLYPDEEESILDFVRCEIAELGHTDAAELWDEDSVQVVVEALALASYRLKVGEPRLRT